MARPPRLEFPGALYHITSRGNWRENIYSNDADREAFLSILSKVCDTHNWICYAYCLMSNHYHLLIETPDANLSRGMRQLNGIYTQTFNRAHGRWGTYFKAGTKPSWWKEKAICRNFPDISCLTLYGQAWCNPRQTGPGAATVQR